MRTIILIAVSLALVATANASEPLGLPSTDLALTVTDSPDPVGVSPLGDLTYTATVTNLGSEAARGVALRIPLGGAFQTHTPSAVLSAGCVFEWSDPTVVACSYALLAPGASVTAVVHTTVMDNAPALLEAGVSTVIAENPDPVPANNSVTVTTRVIPTVGMAGCSGWPEGDSGTTPAPCPARRIGPHDVTTLVDYALEGITATAGVDFVAASGTLTFLPGVDEMWLPIAYIGDTIPEGDEAYVVRLASRGAMVVPEEGPRWINDDDPWPAEAELAHGFMRRSDLAPRAASTGVDFMRVTGEPGSSYEVVVDEVSGDAEPIWVAGGIYQQLDESVGTGSARSLRWITDWQQTAPSWVYVGSTGCAGGCGADDRYRLRFYETTLTGGVAAEQPSVLVLQNPRDEPVKVRVRYHLAPNDGFGTEIAPRASLVKTLPAGPRLVTVGHDAPYGTLVGKIVSIDPETGFVSESILAPRPR